MTLDDLDERPLAMLRLIAANAYGRNVGLQAEGLSVKQLETSQSPFEYGLKDHSLDEYGVLHFPVR